MWYKIFGNSVLAIFFCNTPLKINVEAPLGFLLVFIDYSRSIPDATPFFPICELNNVEFKS